MRYPLEQVPITEEGTAISASGAVEYKDGTSIVFGGMENEPKEVIAILDSNGNELETTLITMLRRHMHISRKVP